MFKNENIILLNMHKIADTVTSVYEYCLKIYNDLR